MAIATIPPHKYTCINEPEYEGERARARRGGEAEKVSVRTHFYFEL